MLYDKLVERICGAFAITYFDDCISHHHHRCSGSPRENLSQLHAKLQLDIRHALFPNPLPAIVFPTLARP